MIGSTCTEFSDDRLKQWYYNPRRTDQEVADYLGVSVDALHCIAEKRGLLTRRELEARGTIKFRKQPEKINHNCDKCLSLQWCRENPYALKLPCEKSPTDFVEREPMPYLVSPNGSVGLTMEMIFDDDGDIG